MNDTLKSVGLIIVAMINSKNYIFWMCLSVPSVMQRWMTMYRISHVIVSIIPFQIISQSVGISEKPDWTQAKYLHIVVENSSHLDSI
jgi:hypothetical protein